MKILVANIGSTSFKYRLFDMEGERVLAEGRAEVGEGYAVMAPEIGALVPDYPSFIYDLDTLSRGRFHTFVEGDWDTALPIMEAGCGLLLHPGVAVRNKVGIGDTIRVSLTAPPREEVTAAYEILKSLNLRQRGPVLVSCPTCGRAEADVVKLAGAVEAELAKIDRPIKVAVMGCVVNGPGEAKDADVGIACGKGKGVIFKKGEQVVVVEEKDFFTALMREVEDL